MVLKVYLTIQNTRPTD